LADIGPAIRIGPPPPEGWRPRLVALDIDGTLISWEDKVEDEIITPRVRGAVRGLVETGAHVVLSSGRSVLGMVRVIDELGLVDLLDEPPWVVACNGAVVFRYPPLDVVHQVTFDAGPAVRAVLELHPTALVAVEDRGVGYRVSQPFPDGELWGEMAVTPVEEIVSEPVHRVVIRDPNATAEDFVALTESLGLHGTDYVVGWTAWMDLMPEGVSKASGLQVVADALGLTPADALAIGDGRNDLEMLAWAGRGVAMGQSVEEVRSAADAVTDLVGNDGAAVELERYLG